MLSFCFDLVMYDNSDMAIWICYSVPEYYDYGHGTSEEAYDSYGKVYSIFSKSMKSTEKICHNSEIASTYFPFFHCFYKDQTKWICGTLGWGLTYWSRTRKLDRSVLIKITKPINHSHRSALTATLKFVISAWIYFTVLSCSLLDVPTVLCICYCHMHLFNQQVL